MDTKKALRSAIVIVLLVIVVGFIGGRLLYNKVSDPMNKVGDTVSCKYFDITIDKVQFRKRGYQADRFTTISDPEWIGVTLTIKNTSKSDQVFKNSIIEVQNNKDEVLTHPVFDYNIWNAVALNNPEIKAGKSKTGYIHFVNTNDNNSKLTLLVKCNGANIHLYNISE